MASFADVNVSQGSVATYARCGGTLNIHLTANFLRNFPVKTFWELFEIWQNYGHESVAPLFWPTLYVQIIVLAEIVKKIEIETAAFYKPVCVSASRSREGLQDKKLSYRRGTARCVVSIEILPTATQQCRNYGTYTTSPDQIDGMKLEI